MRNLRLHIAGSASSSCDAELLSKAHAFVAALSCEIVKSGSGIVTGFGEEPIGDHGIACTFDWTVIDSVVNEVGSKDNWPHERKQRFITVGSQAALERIPEGRKGVWDTFKVRTDAKIVLSPPGWRMAGIIREQQLEYGDVLLVIGGGAGVEHLARMYLDSGKPVIPISVDMSSFHGDGTGGSSRLHSIALSEPQSFFQLRDGVGSGSGRLLDVRLTAETDPEELAAAISILIGDLRNPKAFYVRLMDPRVSEFEDVERFFREVVDPVMVANDLTPDEVGDRTPDVAFIDQDIFTSIKNAGVIFADLTSVRPNCMMELGFALGQEKKVIISAMFGTVLPFDPAHLPTHFWDWSSSVASNKEALATHFNTFIDSPPVI